MEVKNILEKLAKNELTAAEAKYQIQQVLTQKKNNTVPPTFPTAQHTSKLSEEGVLQYVLKTAAKVLKFDPSELQFKEPFESYGIDSIVSMRLVDAFEKDLGALSKTLFFEYRNFEEISSYFFQTFPEPLSKIFQISKESVQPPVLMKEAIRPRVAELTPPIGSASIAVIGLSGKYPKSSNLEEFWENLKQGFDGIGPVPLERWDASEFYDPKKSKLGTICTNRGGFIEGVDEFDDLLFKILPVEAKILDPQDRLFLQGVWEALEDAGYTQESSAAKTGGEVGVYAGIMTNDYSLLSARNAGEITDAFSNGIIAEVANRASYFFDFQGPSITVNTMCSSSLTAIFLAYESLRCGQTKMAIAGGVNLTLHPNKYLVLSDNKLLSSDGLCKSFGEGGKGYVPSEGCGVAVLKRLEDAIQDGDHIYGVIRGASINNSGRSSRYRVPMAKSQAKVIESAHAQANIDPRTISCMEAHGTGTQLGDPIEMDGFLEVFRKNTQETQFCSLGSVKSNIGHTEGAAGIASLSKVLLQMQYKTLVPTIHSEIPNPNIRFESTPFYLQKRCGPWEKLSSDIPRRAGIPSFGAGGSNAYIVVEEWQEPTRPSVSSPFAHLFVLSGANQKRVKAYIERILSFLKKRREHPAYLSESDFQARLVYTFQVGRETMNCRLAVEFTDLDHLQRELNYFLEGRRSDRCLYAEETRGQGDSTDGDDLSLQRIQREWLRGKKVHWTQLWPSPAPIKLSAPTYPFERKKFWITDQPLRFKREVAEFKKEEPHFPTLFATPSWIEKEVLSSPVNKGDNAILIYPSSSRELVDRMELRKGVKEVLELPEYKSASDACLGMAQISSFFQTALKEKRYGETLCMAVIEESDFWKYSYLVGFFLSLTQEKPGIKTKIVQVGKNGELAAKQGIEKERSSGDVLVRYKEDRRSCFYYCALAEHPKSYSLAKEGGVYWIVGGLGGLGRIFARHISAIGKKITLILSGRSIVEKDQLQLLTQELSTATDLVYEICDVTERTSVEHMVGTLTKRYGTIDGILHAGGILKDGWLIRKNLDQLGAVINPKILGVENLDEATRHLNLDYMVFFSSEAGAFGNIGQTDYAGGNSFMDAFAERREKLVEKGERFGKTLSVNWPYWKEGGMRVSEAIEQAMFAATGEVPLETVHGTQALEKMLTLSASRALIVQGDVEKIKEVYGILPPIQIRPKENTNELLDIARSLFAQVSLMQASEIQEDVSFQEYGADSVSLGDLARLFSEKFDIPFNLSFFFENPNLKDVANELANRLGNTASEIQIPLLSEGKVSEWVEVLGEKEKTYERVLTGKEPFLDEHRLFSQPLLPGSSYIEFLMTLGKDFLQGAVSIDECTFQKALFHESQPIRLYLTFSFINKKWRACFWTRTNKGEKSDLVVAQISLATETNGGRRLSSFKTGDNRWSSEEVYSLLARTGFEYGPTFRTVKEFYVHSNQLLISLEAPGESKEMYPFIDGALHSLVGFHTANDEEKNKAPYCLKGVTIYGKFSNQLRVIASKVGESEYSLLLYNHEGELVAEFQNVALISLTNRRIVNQLSLQTELDQSFEELSSVRRRDSPTAKGRQVSCRSAIDSPASSAVNDRDCAPATVQRIVSEIMGLPLEAVDLDLPLMQLGMENFEAVRLQAALQNLYHKEIPFSLFRKGGSLRELIKSFQAIVTHTENEKLENELLDEEIQNMSDDEAALQLEKELL